MLLPQLPAVSTNVAMSIYGIMSGFMKAGVYAGQDLEREL
jgi:hypothetical protein